MTQHPFRVAADATGGVYNAELLEAGVKRTILVLGVSEELGDFEFDTGEIPLAVAWTRTGYVYFYDSTDSTTVDDGLTTLVTGNGLRYAIEDAASISINSVLGVVTAPTGSEVVGDAYIVDAAATDEFAGQDDNLAYLTRRGWVFAAPEIGGGLLNKATGQNTQFTETGWGAFAVEFGDGSIPPVALQFPAGIVVEDTLNTPPGSPTTGKFWIVGSSPSGDFTGHGGDLAYWTGSAWAFMDPADGWAVYHKANGFEVFYASGSWLGASGSNLQTFSTAGGATWTKPARGSMALIEVWGAGGSGGKGFSFTDRAGCGGGGGSYAWRLVPLASLGSTESVTVGAGGVAQTTGANGTAGGNSSFGSWLTAYGGAGGNGNGTTARNAGGGGGMDAAGGVSTGGGPSTFGGAWGGGNGGVSTTSAAVAGSASFYGGGGGGANGDTSSNAGGDGGASVHGGGGGGSRSASGTVGAGGVSKFGGSGGAGANGSNNATAGAQPGGGGGGSHNGNSGKGGDGRVRVTVF